MAVDKDRFFLTPSGLRTAQIDNDVIAEEMRMVKGVLLLFACLLAVYTVNYSLITGYNRVLS